MIRKLLVLLLLPILLFTSCEKEGSTASEEDEVLYLRYADNQPYDYPTTIAARYFSEIVEEQTDGRIVIEVHSDGMLGSEVSVLEQMKFGGIDFARCSLGILSDQYPELAVLTLPFLYRDKTHMWTVLDSDIGEQFLDVFPHNQIHGLAWFDAGARSFYTSRPIRNVDDLKGLRIRVQETDLMMRMFNLLSVEPVKIPYGDVYSALQKNLVDGAENNLPSYFHTGHYEQSPYLYRTDHMRLPEMMLISASTKERIEEFDPSLIDVIRKCAKAAGEYERVLWEREESKAREFLNSHGVVITRPSSEERFKLRFAMQEIYDEFEEYKDIIDRIENM